MARSEEANTATTHFFILVDASPSLDGKFAAFGRVTNGMDVVDAINKAPVTEEKPAKPVRIRKAAVFVAVQRQAKLSSEIQIQRHFVFVCHRGMAVCHGDIDCRVDMSRSLFRIGLFSYTRLPERHTHYPRRPPWPDSSPVGPITSSKFPSFSYSLANPNITIVFSGSVASICLKTSILFCIIKPYHPR